MHAQQDIYTTAFTYQVGDVPFGAPRRAAIEVSHCPVIDAVGRIADHDRWQITDEANRHLDARGAWMDEAAFMGGIYYGQPGYQERYEQWAARFLLGREQALAAAERYVAAFGAPSAADPAGRADAAKREVFTTEIHYTVSDRPFGSPGGASIGVHHHPSCPAPGQIADFERWTVTALQGIHLSANGTWCDHARFMDGVWISQPGYRRRYEAWAAEYLFTRQQALDLARDYLATRGAPQLHELFPQLGTQP